MRIAILDHDKNLCAVACQLLIEAGHHCQAFQEGGKLIAELRRESFDLLVLERELPGFSGLEVLEWVRENLLERLPVLLLSYRSSEDDIVQGLMAGADDYMTKPLRHTELIARVSALYRRAYPSPNSTQPLAVGPFEFDWANHQVKRAGTLVELTQKEFDLASLLFQNIGRLLSRSHIQEAVWGHHRLLPSRTMDTHMSRVRSKLLLRPAYGFRLMPLYNFGYRLETTNA